jgi:hypothetical protein
VDGKCKYSVRDGGSGKATGVDIESRAPAVVHIWRKLQPDFARNLGPHMDRGAGILPILQGTQLGPLVRCSGKIIWWHTFLHPDLENLFIQVGYSLYAMPTLFLDHNVRDSKKPAAAARFPSGKKFSFYPSGYSFVMLLIRCY